MRLISKALALGGLAYAGHRAYRHFSSRSRSGAPIEGDTQRDDAQDAELVGISAVDPEPLTTMGEAVDPDAVTNAHQDLPDQADKLPDKPVR